MATRNKRRKKPLQNESVPTSDIPNNQSQLQQLVRQEVRTELYQGLVPHPDTIAKFEKLYPGAAQFFFEEVEKQTNHRISMETKVVESNIQNEKRGSWFAFIITMTALIGGFILVGLGYKVSGVITAVGGLAVLVGVFITGKVMSIKQLQQKRNQ